VKIGGIGDHVHLVVSIPPTLSIRRSTFAWQDGYGAFTVSKSQLPDVLRYVEGRCEHHRRQTFQEEYRALLDRHGIDYDEKYL